MARVFVSYSRKNKDFCRQLTTELQKRELDLWVDWEGIPPTVDWMKEIEKSIEEADTFLAIVSPDWISSKVCTEELDIAVKNGKRLIPVVPCDIDWHSVPATLAHLNFIFFTEAFDFQEQLKKLFTALDTDYDWLKTHRRLQVKALEWERGNKDNGFLLRGRDLQEAEQQVSINAAKEPNPTELQRKYVLTSRKETDRQNKIRTNSLRAAVAVMLGIIAVLAYPFFAERNAQRSARGELVLIPAGLSTFGVNNADSEVGTAVPLQQILLPAFRIGKYEVSNGEYKLCVTYGNCTVPLEQADYKKPEYKNHPVRFVTLFQANTFCRWIGQRLPTEVEWERAARGPHGASWPWGEKLPSPEFVNMPAQGTYTATQGTQPFDSNPQAVSYEEVYNLVGNVSEWTSSFLYTGGDYSMAYWDGKEDSYQGTAFYAIRGGSWANKIEYISQITPSTGTEVREDIGFRCAASTE